jgi:hypothetical protein
MFPDLDRSDAYKGQLAHCMRLLPHLNDTGGFFVATFTKLSHKAAEVATRSSCAKAMLEQHGRSEKNCYDVLQPDDATWGQIAAFYGIPKDFDSSLVVREFNVSGDCKKLNLVTPGLKRLLGCKSLREKNTLQVLSLGVRLFVQLDSTFLTEHCECRWRPSQVRSNSALSLSRQLSLTFSFC